MEFIVSNEGAVSFDLSIDFGQVNDFIITVLHNKSFHETRCRCMVGVHEKSNELHRELSQPTTMNKFVFLQIN